eukprot:scaffold1174_cov234-Ochromonas_danica.AAC.4
MQKGHRLGFYILCAAHQVTKHLLLLSKPLIRAKVAPNNIALPSLLVSFNAKPLASKSPLSVRTSSTSCQSPVVCSNNSSYSLSSLLLLPAQLQQQPQLVFHRLLLIPHSQPLLFFLLHDDTWAHPHSPRQRLPVFEQMLVGIVALPPMPHIQSCSNASGSES